MSKTEYTPEAERYLREPRMTLHFTGTVTTPTGLAVTKKSWGDVQRLPRAGGADRDTARVLIPGTNFGGALRRALMDDIVAARAQADLERPYKTLHGFFVLRVGGVSGFPTVPVGADIHLRAVNPFISLWGKAGLAGRFGICSAEALDGMAAVAIENGFRGNDLRRFPEVIEMLSPQMIEEYKALQIGSKTVEDGEVAKAAFKSGDFGKIQTLAKRYDESFAEIETSDEENEKASDNGSKKDDKGKGITPIQNPWGGYEYFVPGTRFRHKMSLGGVTETEAALAVGALYAFSRNPRQGGHWRSGLGWVEFNYDAILLTPDPLARHERAGTLRIRCPLTNAEDAFGDEDLAPAFSATGRVRDLLDRYLEMRAAGFPNIDFEAGADEDRKAIKVRGKKGGSRGSGKKTGNGKTENKGGEQSTTPP